VLVGGIGVQIENFIAGSDERTDRPEQGISNLVGSGMPLVFATLAATLFFDDLVASVTNGDFATLDHHRGFVS